MYRTGFRTPALRIADFELRIVQTKFTIRNPKFAISEFLNEC